MNNLILLTDGSVDVQSKIGYGAALLLAEDDILLDCLKDRVQTKRFEQTSSTKLELQTMLWALSDLQFLNRKITIYTDSQNIVGLPGRRKRFEQNDYHSTKNKLLTNHELYKEFFRITDQLNFELIKVKGHKVSYEKDNIDKLFTLVDRASRNALRENSF